MMMGFSPADISPACSMLWKMGFRFDGRKWLCYPPIKTNKKFPALRRKVPAVCHPYYAGADHGWQYVWIPDTSI